MGSPWEVALIAFTFMKSCSKPATLTQDWIKRSFFDTCIWRRKLSFTAFQTVWAGLEYSENDKMVKVSFIFVTLGVITRL